MARELLRRVLARRENILSLIAAGSAVIVVGLNILTDVVTESVFFGAIVLLLGLLAASSVLEREQTVLATERTLAIVKDELEQLRRSQDQTTGVLGDAATTLQEGNQELSLAVAELHRPVFYRVSEVPPLARYIAEADELFYAGGHLHSLIQTNMNLFIQWLKDGKSLRFILQDPEVEGLHTLKMPCVHYSAPVYIAQIEDSLNKLRLMRDRVPNARLGVRATDITPTQSLSILDGHRGGTDMCILFHLPNGEAGSAPFVRLRRSETGEWFNLFFERFYELLWGESRPIIEHPDDQ